MLDLTKPIQTRDGRQVRILCTDLKRDDDYKIVATVVVNGNETTTVRQAARSKRRVIP